MKRSIWTLALAAVLGALIALPVAAASPSVSKRVGTDEDGKTVVVVTVAARDQIVYGVDIEDASGSIQDIKAPAGWLGITDGGRLIFRTGGKPIKAGSTLSFRIYTDNTGAPLSVSFRNVKNDVVGNTSSI